MTYSIGTATTNGSLWSCDVLLDKRLFCSVINVNTEEEAIRRAEAIAASMNILLDHDHDHDHDQELGAGEDFRNIGIVLRNERTCRYHPIYCAPDLSSADGSRETIPYKPFMVHTKGFDTIDEAVSDKTKTCMRMGWDAKPWVMDWDGGVSIPEDSFEVAVNPKFLAEKGFQHTAKTP